jgi:hypothetical protein
MAVPQSVSPIRYRSAVTLPMDNHPMARTHGTRSAYNAGCRCDACREVTRLARARHRGSSGLDATPTVIAPLPSEDDASFPTWTLAGVITACVGICALWRGMTMQIPDDTDTHAARRTRRRWCLGGVVLTAAGVAVAVRAS